MQIFSYDVKPRYDFKVIFPTVDYKYFRGWFQNQGDFNIIDREMYGKVRVISPSIWLQLKYKYPKNMKTSYLS